MKPNKILLAIACVALLLAGCKKEPNPKTSNVPVNSVSLNKTSLNLIEGVSETLVATISPTTATNKNLSWSSNKTDIATVDQSGKVTAVAAGEAIITVTTEDGAKTANCTITVRLLKTATNSGGVKLVYIPAGSFTMGCPEDEPGGFLGERTQKEVTISKGFYISECEITNAQYCAFLNTIISVFDIEEMVGDAGFLVKANCPLNVANEGDIIARTEPNEKGLCYNKDQNKFYVATGYEDYPMRRVTWYGAYEFTEYYSCATSKDEGLPTEEQWEYACRAGQTESLPFGLGIGTKLVKGMACFAYSDPYDLAEGGPYEISETNPTGPCKVGSFEPNAWGIYDMHGNVAEWCKNKYDDDTYLVKGGAYNSPATVCRSAYHTHASPGLHFSEIGFRVVYLEDNTHLYNMN